MLGCDVKFDTFLRKMDEKETNTVRMNSHGRGQNQTN